jgi:hypothetical protein
LAVSFFSGETVELSSKMGSSMWSLTVVGCIFSSRRASCRFVGECSEEEEVRRCSLILTLSHQRVYAFSDSGSRVHEE